MVAHASRLDVHGRLEHGEVAAAAAAQPAAGLPGHPRLLVAGQEHPLGDARLVIGRGADADLVLADPGVSRRHAEIKVDGLDHVVVDLGSTNGTHVDGMPVQHARLTNGTVIRVGTTDLVYRRDEGGPQ